MLSKFLVLYFQLFRPRRVKFGVWTRLEIISTNIQKAVEAEITKFPLLVIEYTSTALHISPKTLEKLFWVDTVQMFFLAKSINSPKKIPILLPASSRKKEKETVIGWEYEGRDSYYYSHLLAYNYGWKLQYIEKLDVDTALAHIQEILTEKQLEREFLWSMSEIAYPYNSSTQQSKFSPLTRPYFMGEVAKEIKKIRVLKEMIPVGVIKNESGMDKYFEEIESKKVDIIGDIEGS